MQVTVNAGENHAARHSSTAGINGKAERRRSQGLARRRARPHRRSSRPSPRRTAAVELAKACDHRRGCLSTHTLGRRRMLTLDKAFADLDPVHALREQNGSARLSQRYFTDDEPSNKADPAGSRKRRRSRCQLGSRTIFSSQLFRADMHCGLPVEKVQQDDHAVILSQITDLTDQPVKGTALDRNLLPDTKRVLGLADHALYFAGCQVFNKASWQKARPASRS